MAVIAIHDAAGNIVPRSRSIPRRASALTSPSAAPGNIGRAISFGPAALNIARAAPETLPSGTLVFVPPRKVLMLRGREAAVSKHARTMNQRFVTGSGPIADKGT
jgi:hypothetical protein